MNGQFWNSKKSSYSWNSHPYWEVRSQMKMQLFHIYANKVKHGPFPSKVKYIANKVNTTHFQAISKATSKSVICNLSCVHGANFVEIFAFRIWD